MMDDDLDMGWVYMNMFERPTLTKSITRRCCSGEGALTDESDRGAGISFAPFTAGGDEEEEDVNQSKIPIFTKGFDEWQTSQELFLLLTEIARERLICGSRLSMFYEYSCGTLSKSAIRN